MYQQIALSTHVLVGSPGPVPDIFDGLTDAQIADLGAFSDPPPAGFDGMGFWPVVVAPPSPFDPSSQVAVDPDPASYAADPASRTVRAQQTARAMTVDEQAAAHPVPDTPTLSDWRVALTLWGRMDDVTAKAAALVASSDAATAMTGKIVTERLEYANNVLRAQLLALKDALGFTAADVDESLWRAHQVSLGDLSGKWPPAA